MNIYAPNENHLPFFHTISELLTTYNSIPTVLGGDFNSIPQPSMDKSSQPSKYDWKTSKALLELCREAGLADVWRVTHSEVETIHSTRMFIEVIQE